MCILHAILTRYEYIMRLWDAITLESDSIIDCISIILGIYNFYTHCYFPFFSTGLLCRRVSLRMIIEHYQ